MIKLCGHLEAGYRTVVLAQVSKFIADLKVEDGIYPAIVFKSTMQAFERDVLPSSNSALRSNVAE